MRFARAGFFVPQRGYIGATTLEYRTSGTAAVARYARGVIDLPMDDDPAILRRAVPRDLFEREGRFSPVGAATRLRW
jgi:hypothetical protein